MGAVGIRELKNSLSRHVRRAAKGERIAVTQHGRVVAVLAPPMSAQEPSRLDELVQAGVIRPPVETGDPTAAFPRERLLKGSASELLNDDRDDR